MKKFICCMMLMVATLVTSAAIRTEVYSPPEYDIGYVQGAVTTLSMDGVTIASYELVECNIVYLQTHVKPYMEVGKKSVQVVDAYSIPCNEGDISMALVSYRWPIMKNEKATSRFKFYSEYVLDGFTYSFMPSLTDFV